MGAPAAVKRQIDEANKIQQDIIEGKTDEPEPAKPGETVVSEKVVDKTEDPPASKDEPAKSAEPAPEKDSELTLLRNEVEHQKKRVVDFKKMYDKVVTENKSVIEGLRSEVGDLKSQLDSKQTVDTDIEFGEVINKARDDYGDELVDSIIKQVASEIRPAQPEPAKPAPAAREDSQEPDKPAPANESPTDVWGYLQAFDSQTDWRAVNKEPEFLEWLAVKDYNGNTRFDVLNYAMKEGRFTDAAQLFIEWDSIKREQRIETARGSVGEEEHIMPDSGGNNSQVPVKVSFTGEQYQTEKTNIAKGRYKPEDAAELNRQLEEAYTAGRIAW